MPAFAWRNSVMFQHCDPAGIVFYPRYFEMINAAIETFFADAVGWSFARMHGRDRVGVPAARIDTEFHAASRLGDDLDWSLRVTRIGGASLDLVLHATGDDGSARLTARATLVLVSLDPLKSKPWPEHTRRALERYLEDAPQ